MIYRISKDPPNSALAISEKRNSAIVQSSAKTAEHTMPLYNIMAEMF